MNTPVSSRQYYLQNAIARDFGSIREFRHAFFRATQHAGKEDCVWLLVAPDGTLQITVTKNRHRPRGSILLLADLWEGGHVSFTPESNTQKIRRHWHAIDWNAVGAYYNTLMQCLPRYPTP